MGTGASAIVTVAMDEEGILVKTGKLFLTKYLAALGFFGETIVEGTRKNEGRKVPEESSSIYSPHGSHFGYNNLQAGLSGQEGEIVPILER